MEPFFVAPHGACSDRRVPGRRSSEAPGKLGIQKHKPLVVSLKFAHEAAVLADVAHDLAITATTICS